MTLDGASFDPDYERWFIRVGVPDGTPAELYDLVVEATGGIVDTVAHSVAVRDTIDDNFYFVHITDSHLPGHLYYGEPGAATDTTEMTDLREVIRDINLVNPAFVLLTGDVVNEGELEDLEERRVFTRAQRLLKELDVPVYLVTGNHDVGGWDWTPPPDGTSRWNWWKFFGWRYLYDPPPAEVIYTQNYTFDYGQVHFIGLDAYINYDDWRDWIYGDVSFTWRQMQWLMNDLNTVDPDDAVVAFYHYDFDSEMELGSFGIDCTLWGHIHWTTGQIETPPFDLSTGPTCDGNRWMRLMRVQGNTILPTEPVWSGDNGNKLRVNYVPQNDGTSATVTATITNTHDDAFEHGLVKFHVLADSIPYAVEGGELVQTIVDGATATCYVKVPIPANDSIVVTLEPTTGIPDVPTTAALLRPAHPNPARAGTTIEFVLGFRAEVTLAVYDVAGRKIATLRDGTVDPGPHEVPWDLTDAAGHHVASGVYFYRLDAGEHSITKKMVVVQ